MAPGDHRYSSASYELKREEALRRFGRMIRRWRMANGWTQYVGERITKECGIQSLSPSNWSNIENGKAGDLKPSTLFRLAELNWRVANNDFAGVRSRELRDWLDGSRAIETAEGVPWCATDFFAAAHGLLEPPEWLAASAVPELSDQQAEKLCMSWRQQFAQIAAEHHLHPQEALSGASAYAPAAERTDMQSVLIGIKTYSAAELRNGWNQDWLPARALKAWAMQIRHKQQSVPAVAQDEQGAS